MPACLKTDIEVLALAMEHGCVLITDDYRMQNIAEYSKIKWRSVNTGGIKNIWKWEIVCLGCKTVKIMPEKSHKPEKRSRTMCRLWITIESKKEKIIILLES
ncbi:MAG: hypothetical protein ACJZ4Z_02030 [Candidatus Thalassarchaeaceae archaeon]